MNKLLLSLLLVVSTSVFGRDEPTSLESGFAMMGYYRGCFEQMVNEDTIKDLTFEQLSHASWICEYKTTTKEGWNALSEPLKNAIRRNISKSKKDVQKYLWANY